MGLLRIGCVPETSRILVIRLIGAVRSPFWHRCVTKPLLFVHFALWMSLSMQCPFCSSLLKINAMAETTTNPRTAFHSEVFFQTFGNFSGTERVFAVLEHGALLAPGSQV